MRLIKNGKIVNEGNIEQLDILIDGDTIIKIAPNIEYDSAEIIDASGKYILPGLIDTHVHFREPGLTHKEDIQHGSMGAAYSGITSIMEMPNTNPATLSFENVEAKCELAAKSSIVNYSFFIGVDENNLDDLKDGDFSNNCGIKLFMGSSTGNMALKSDASLEKLFKEANVPIVIHSEDDEIIEKNSVAFTGQYGDSIPMFAHSFIRSDKACYKSTVKAIELATKFGTKIHLAHLSSKKELELLKDIPHKEKNITAEVCVHHLFFENSDFETLGAKIKCNPSIKFKEDRDALRVALNSHKIDTIATDHAPHTMDEKNNGNYFSTPSGIPIIENSLPIMLSLYRDGLVSLEIIVEKMAHNPAEIFSIERRGFLREGYFADIAIVDLDIIWKKESVISKCNWSPCEGYEFTGKVVETIVNGSTVFKDEIFYLDNSGKRLTFRR